MWDITAEFVLDSARVVGHITGIGEILRDTKYVVGETNGLGRDTAEWRGCGAYCRDVRG